MGGFSPNSLAPPPVLGFSRRDYFRPPAGRGHDSAVAGLRAPNGCSIRLQQQHGGPLQPGPSVVQRRVVLQRSRSSVAELRSAPRPCRRKLGCDDERPPLGGCRFFVVRKRARVRSGSPSFMRPPTPIAVSLLPETTLLKNGPSQKAASIARYGRRKMAHNGTRAQAPRCSALGWPPVPTAANKNAARRDPPPARHSAAIQRQGHDRARGTPSAMARRKRVITFHERQLSVPSPAAIFKGDNLYFSSIVPGLG